MLDTQFRDGESQRVLYNLDESLQSENKQQKKKKETRSCPPALIDQLHGSQHKIKLLVGFQNEVWRQNSLQILLIVLKFINALTQTLFPQKFCMLNEKLFEIIGDVASDFSYYQFRNYFKYNGKSWLYQRVQTFSKLQMLCKFSILEELRKSKFYVIFNQQKFLLKPESNFLLIWNIYILIMLNLALMYISAKFAFSLEFRESVYESYRYVILYLIPLFSFVVDIGIKLNTRFYEKGQLISDRKKIIQFYFESGLILDFGVVLSQLIYFYAKIQYLDLIVLLKIIQIPTLTEHLLDKLEFTPKQFALYDLTRLCYFMLIETHFICCGWYYIGSLNDEISWLIKLDIHDEDWLLQYFYSFYWSIITMTTIGYGDITPTNLQEKGYVIIIALISCCTFGYSVSSIGQIFAQLQKNSNQMRIDLNSLKRHLRKKDYSHQLQIKILRYFEYVWSVEMKDNSINLQNFQKQLPNQLKEEMLIDLNLRALKGIPFLNKSFTSQFLLELSMKFTEEKYGPYQQIYSSNSYSQYLYILIDGSVEYYITLKDSGKAVNLQTINKQFEALGHKEFFAELDYQVNCRALNSARCIRINRQDFNEIASRLGYVITGLSIEYCQIRDSLQCSKRNDIIELRCAGCNKTTHQIYQCPQVTGFPNKVKLLLKYKKREYQERRKYFRQNRCRKMSALNDEANICDSVLCYLLQDSFVRQQIVNQYQIETDDTPVTRIKRLKPVEKQRNLRYIFKQFPRPFFMKDLQQIARQQNNQKFENHVTFQVIQNEVTEFEQKKLEEDIKKSINYKLMYEDQQIINEISIISQKKIEHKSILKSKNDESDNSNTNQKKDRSKLLADSMRIIEKNASSLRNELWSDFIIDNESSSYYPKKSESNTQPSQNQEDIKMGKYKDIFNDFDKMQNFESYMKHMNLTVIIQKVNELLHRNSLHRFLNDNISNINKRKSKYY